MPSRLVVNARTMVIVYPYNTRCAMQQTKSVSALHSFSSLPQTRHYAWTVSMNANHKLNVNVVLLYLSKWLLFNAAKWAHFQLHHGENMVHVIKWWWCQFCTRWTGLVEFLLISHSNNNPQVDLSLHSNILSWFRANQSCYFLFMLYDQQRHN